MEFTKQELRQNIISILKKSKQKSLDYTGFSETFDLTDTKLILAYIPLKTEVDTTQFINRCLAKNIEVAVPTSDYFSFAVLPADWKEKQYKLPNGTQTVKTDKFIDIRTISQKTIIIVPGLLFTKDGRRLGRGAGFYDRVLKAVQNNKQITSVGICTDIQITKDLPSDSNDISVSKLFVI